MHFQCMQALKGATKIKMHVLLTFCSAHLAQFSPVCSLFSQLLWAFCIPAWTATWESHTNSRGSGPASWGASQCSSVSTTPVLYPFTSARFKCISLGLIFVLKPVSVSSKEERHELCRLLLLVTTGCPASLLTWYGARFLQVRQIFD